MQEAQSDVLALILDLRRRVALLEQGIHGHAAPEVGLALLTRCYREAHHALRKMDAESAGIWVSHAYLWDAQAFVALGRHVHDPFPYRPLLAVLDLCVLQGIQDAAKARQHVEEVGRDVLRAQGLELVEPRDTMGALRLVEALERLASRR